MLKKLVFALTLTCSSITIGHAQRTNIESFTNTAVLIEYNSRELVNYATGFFYITNGSMFLITAAHVLFESSMSSNGQTSTILSSDTISISYYSKDPVTDSITTALIDTKSLFSKKQIVYNQAMDLAVIRIGKYVPHIGFDPSELNFTTPHQPNPASWSRDHMKSMNNVTVGEDVYLAGYPKSLTIWLAEHIDYNRPLLREGVLAGIDVAHQAIIVDCPTYPGNSGGPVAVSIDSTLYLVGVVSRFVPLVNKTESLIYHNVNTHVYNSGYSAIMPMDYVNKLIDNNFPQD